MTNAFQITPDPDVLQLKVELERLQLQFSNLNFEKIEAEKILAEFQHRHTLELGEIILQILELKKLQFKFKSIEYEEAKNDERRYREKFEVEKKVEVFELSDEQKQELKKSFRKASNLCHPDKVIDKFKEVAQRMFIELKYAYDINDLHKVISILEELENGHFFDKSLSNLSERDKLKSAIARLQKEIGYLEHELITLKKSSSFQLIINISNWDDYFTTMRNKLLRELSNLKDNYSRKKDN